MFKQFFDNALLKLEVFEIQLVAELDVRAMLDQDLFGPLLAEIHTFTNPNENRISNTRIHADVKSHMDRTKSFTLTMKYTLLDGEFTTQVIAAAVAANLMNTSNKVIVYDESTQDEEESVLSAAVAYNVFSTLLIHSVIKKDLVKVTGNNVTQGNLELYVEALPKAASYAFSF